MTAPDCQVRMVCPCTPHQADLRIEFSCGCVWFVCAADWNSLRLHYCPVCKTAGIAAVEIGAVA